MFQSIIKGNRTDKRKNYIDIGLYDRLIQFYEEKEDYEKCSSILKKKKEILNHDENFTLPQ